MNSPSFSIVVKQADDYVIKLYDEKMPEGFHYHCNWHNQDVLKNAVRIGKYCRLSDHDLDLLRLATIFHDVGYIDTYAGHEALSVKYATDFLHNHNVDDDAIQNVNLAIYATKIPQKPPNMISQILCDADLFYLSDQRDYFRQAELLRREWNDRGIEQFDEEAFHKNSLDFFARHHYWTEYGKDILQPGKEKVAELIKNKLSALKSKSTSKI
jgi:predicted metal-dependent HD superfamily phosphohydrolase